MGYTHNDKVSGINGLAVGPKGSEIVVASATGALYQQGVVITASAAEINAISGGGLSAAELGILNGATVTTAELNVLDASANTETILVAGAINPATRITYLSAASGAYAVTLAVPSAAMLGQVKVIEMTVAGNNITLALTNVQGGTAGTTATFNAVNETLVLVAGSLKWNVVGESGVTLT